MEGTEESYRKIILADAEKRWGKESACYKILEIEPRIDLLHLIMGCEPKIASVIETSDKHFLGMSAGDIGYNVWFGQPSDIAKQRTGDIYKKLDSGAKLAVMLKLNNPDGPINPSDVGIPMMSKAQDGRQD